MNKKKNISNFNFNNIVSQQNLLYLPSTVMDNKQFIVAQTVTFLHFSTFNILHAEEKYPDSVGKRPDPIYTASYLSI
jgi:hypothetical protein